MDRVREALRVRHYALTTERTYCHWIKAYILHQNKRHPADMGAAEVEQYLSHLALQRDVAASTQNQAMHALLFLYKHVLGVDLPWLDNITRAKTAKRLPSVLTVAETAALLRCAQNDTNGLIIALLYGTGMRVSEALRLRIKDVDLTRREIRNSEPPRQQWLLEYCWQKAGIQITPFKPIFQPPVGRPAAQPQLPATRCLAVHPPTHADQAGCGR